MSREGSVDFLVIGAGIAGASIAAALVRHGSVLVLEAEDQPGYHTTRRSASMHFECHGQPAMRAMIRCSRQFLESPPDWMDTESFLSALGVLLIARADQVSALEDFARTMFDDSAQILRGGETLARERHAGLRGGYVAECLWHPHAAEIDVHALLRTYLRAARRRGAELRNSERVVALARTGAHWSVRTNRSRYHAAVLINAAGAWANEIGRLAGAPPINLIPRRRSVCLVPAGEATVAGWPMVGDVEQQFYFKPEGENLLLSPSEETPVAPGDAHADELAIARAVAGLEASTDVRVTTKITRQWAGLRSFVTDRLPVVGYDTRAEGFFWLAGQGGDGIQTAPAISRLAAALILGEDLPGDLARSGLTRDTLSPQRPAIARISN